MEKNTLHLIYLAVNTSFGDDFSYKTFAAGEHLQLSLHYDRNATENYSLQLKNVDSINALSEAQHNFLQCLIGIIDENLDKPLTVEFLAKKMIVSKSTLNRKLSNSIGLSANELIRRYRLKKAASYLIAGKNVSESAYLAGFETASYFTQCFKGFYNVTPKEYLKTIRQQIMDQSINGSIAV